MKKTKKQPVIVSIVYPDGQRLESRIPLWKAYMILADLEREKLLNEKLTPLYPYKKHAPKTPHDNQA